MSKSPALKTNVVELACTSDSKIINVSLYNGLAEITRVCTPQLKDGDNKVIISGLPNVLLPESLRCVPPSLLPPTSTFLWLIFVLQSRGPWSLHHS